MVPVDHPIPVRRRDRSSTVMHEPPLERLWMETRVEWVRWPSQAAFHANEHERHLGTPPRLKHDIAQAVGKMRGARLSHEA